MFKFYTILCLTFFVSLVLFPAAYLNAQTPYEQEILQSREYNKTGLFKGERAPLKENEIQFLRYFQVDSIWRKSARLERISDTTTVLMPTSSGKIKYFKRYAYLRFEHFKQSYTLTAFYALKDTIKKEEPIPLFIPFNDLSNGELTYGGGRYIESSTSEIIDNTLVLDFNSCFNPYCAYTTGYNCPVPPAENRLSLSIEAGEQNFAKPH
jgi:uncharacterized protein (DUF1684 family)